jgi:hypothetical protein
VRGLIVRGTVVEIVPITRKDGTAVDGLLVVVIDCGNGPRKMTRRVQVDQYDASGVESGAYDSLVGFGPGAEVEALVDVKATKDGYVNLSAVRFFDAVPAAGSSSAPLHAVG